MKFAAQWPAFCATSLHTVISRWQIFVWLPITTDKFKSIITSHVPVSELLMHNKNFAYIMQSVSITSFLQGKVLNICCFKWLKRQVCNIFYQVSNIFTSIYWNIKFYICHLLIFSSVKLKLKWKDEKTFSKWNNFRSSIESAEKEKKKMHIRNIWFIVRHYVIIKKILRSVCQIFLIINDAARIK